MGRVKQSYMFFTGVKKISKNTNSASIRAANVRISYIATKETGITQGCPLNMLEHQVRTFFFISSMMYQ